MNAVSLRGENGDFTYSLSGNTVSIAMADESKPGSSLTYADGKLSDPQKQTFAPSTPKQTEQVLAWFEAWSGGNSGHYEMIEYVERSWNGERVAECTIIARAEWLNEVNQGGRITIRGGSVYAYGVVDGAGIGGGEDGDGGIITISGGYVEARGDDYGSGIGAGEDGNGGIITITTTDGPCISMPREAAIAAGGPAPSDPMTATNSAHSYSAMACRPTPGLIRHTMALDRSLWNTILWHTSSSAKRRFS